MAFWGFTYYTVIISLTNLYQGISRPVYEPILRDSDWELSRFRRNDQGLRVCKEFTVRLRV